MTADISRLFRDPEKRFHGIVHQQGRLPIDADDNHGIDIAQWTDEQRFVETIAPSGSPDDGFKIALAGAGAPVDFTILAGSYYLGGSRVENPADLDYRDQRDLNWLPFPLDAEGLTNEAIGGARRFLVWLDAWEAVVTAVEDSELIEPGIGVDSTARKRFAWRVRATPVDGPGCIRAATQWLAARNWTGLVDADTGLLASGATLTVGFDPAAVDQDLCQPSLTPGFLGARNECFRVMVTRAGRYVWGVDDAAPLYRVQVDPLDPRRLVFLDLPRDEFVRPRAGHTIELLRWDQLLPNGQKTAEPMGEFYKVTGGFVDDGIVVGADVNLDWRNWLGNLSPAMLSDHDDPDEQRYFYLRLWTGGGQGAQPDIPFATDELPGTGLAVTFSAGTLPGDYWIIAARPNAPQGIMPWALLDGMAAHGPRRHVVPLAFVDLDTMTVIDCRRRFRPLYKLGGCCTVTVGDGVSSWGDVSTIAAAIARLPASGGEICLGPGRHIGPVLIDRRVNVKISGCGRRSLIVLPDGVDDPAITVNGGSDIKLVNFGIEAPLGPGIRATGLIDDGEVVPLRRLFIERLEITCRDGPGIDAQLVEDVVLRDSHIVAQELAGDLVAGSAAGRAPAVFLEGDDMLVAGNRIEALGPRAVRRALGGLHIGGGSERVIVRENLIRGGNGNGITLGHIFLVTREIFRKFTRDYSAARNDALLLWVGFTIGIDEHGCIVVTPPGSGDDPDDPDLTPVSGGDLRDIEIRHNIIERMELSGIATPIAFRHIEEESRPVIVAIAGLKIDNNTIRGCATLEVPVLPLAVRLFVAFGGIALCAVEVGALTGNHLEANGRSHLEPIVGIQLVTAETVVISNNRIIDNGPRTDTDQLPKPGQRGGIVVLDASPHPTAHASSPDFLALRKISSGFAGARAVGLPALMVHDNIVQQPLGKALVILGYGNMSVSANHLSSQGTTTRSFLEPLFEIFQAGQDLPAAQLIFILVDRLLGSTVTIVNTGYSSELGELMLLAQILEAAEADGAGGTGGGLTRPGSFVIDSPPDVTTVDSLAGRGWAGSTRLLRSGDVLFNDNEVMQSFLDGQRSFTLSAALLVSFDDLSVADNTFSSQVDFIGDFSVTSLLGMSWSLRCSSNRFEETLLHSLYSAMTFGLYNSTVHNQGTHCFRIVGVQALKVDEPNRSLVQLFNPLACGGCLKPPFAGLTKRAFRSNGATVQPELRTFGGIQGLWFADRLEIDFGAEVDEVTLGFVGKDVTLRVESLGATGTNQTLHLPPDGTEATMTLRGSRMDRIVISQGGDRAILTRLCAARPQAATGGSIDSANIFSIGG